MCFICHWKREKFIKKPHLKNNYEVPRCLTLEEATPTDDTTTDTVSLGTTEEEDMDLHQESSVVKSPQRLQDKK